MNKLFTSVGSESEGPGGEVAPRSRAPFDDFQGGRSAVTRQGDLSKHGQKGQVPLHPALRHAVYVKSAYNHAKTTGIMFNIARD